MQKLQKTFLEKLAKGAFNTARKEADSACFCFGYQPRMPEKVKELRKKK